MGDTRAIEVINQIREGAKAELESSIQQVQEQVTKLQQENIRLSQKLEPLLQFEPVLNMKIEDLVRVMLYDLTETEQRYLEALARKTYPMTAKKYDEIPTGQRKPLNKLFTDLTKKLVEGAGQYTLTEFQRLIVDKFFIVRDG